MQKVILIYLGKYGAGPKLTLDFYNEFRKNDAVEAGVIISDTNSIKDTYISNEGKYNSNNLNILPLGSSAIDLMINFIPFLIEFSKVVLSQKSSNNKHNAYLFTMLHPLNFLCMIIVKILDPSGKIFTIVHDANPHPGDRNAILNKLITKFEINFADYVVTLSTEVADILKRSNKNIKCITFPHGVFDYGFVSEPRNINRYNIFKILSIGRVVKYKGYHLLLDAYKILKGLGYKVQLTIAGDGPIYSLINKKDLDGLNVIIDNKYLSDEEIKMHLENTDIIALSYIEASQSGVLALASSKALPVVATPVGGLSEQCIAMGNAILSDDVTAESFADGIKKLLDDKDLYFQLSKNSIAAQQKISWREGVDKVLEVCK